MKSFLSGSEGEDSDIEKNVVGRLEHTVSGTVLSSDDEETLASPPVNHPSESLGTRDHRPNLDTHKEESLRVHELQQQVRSLSSELQELRQKSEDLGQKNEQLQEEMQARSQSLSCHQQERESKLKADWEAERGQQDRLIRERWCMEREDERVALQREVVQQVHRARNILSQQGMALVRRSEHLASEYANLEEQAHCQAAEHKSQKQLVAELREAVSHVEYQQVQHEERASMADRRNQELESQCKEASAKEAARFESVVAALRSELDSAKQSGVEDKQVAAEIASMSDDLKCARTELAMVQCEKRACDERMDSLMAEARFPLCDVRKASLSKIGELVGLSTQGTCAQRSTAIVSTLLQQFQSISEGNLTAEGKPNCVVMQQKVVRALERHTQLLERTNCEWASHLVEQGSASHEWASSLSQPRKRKDVTSSPGPIPYNELSHGLPTRPVRFTDLQHTTDRLQRLETRLHVLCQSER